MFEPKRIISALVVDDDEDDQILLRDAFEECDPSAAVNFMDDGKAFMEYLLQTDTLIISGETPPTPRIIILDINMPRLDGRYVLTEIRKHERWSHVPVIIFSTSGSMGEIAEFYRLGASSFIIKPNSFEKLVDIVRSIIKYWFDTATIL